MPRVRGSAETAHDKGEDVVCRIFGQLGEFVREHPSVRKIYVLVQYMQNPPSWRFEVLDRVLACVDDPEVEIVDLRERFAELRRSDPFHYGTGSVTVYEGTVFLGADFEVGPGPKFHVYLVPLDQVTPNTEVDEVAFVDLGRLRAFKGSQVFPVPADLKLTDYGSVVIWCQQFGVLVSPAKLNFEDAAAR